MRASAPAVEARSDQSGTRRILYPELWPAELRAAVILAVAIIAVYSGSWAAPIVERPVSGSALSMFLFDLGQRLGGEDTRPYHAAMMLLHLVSAALLAGILQRILARFGKGDVFVPACLGALAWAVHPVLTEAVIAPSRGGAVLGGLLIFAPTYGLLRVMSASPQSSWALVAMAGLLAAASWLIVTGGSVFAGVKLVFWPSPLVYDHGVAASGSPFREANLYFPMAVLGVLVAFAAAKVGSRRALVVLVLPLTALGVLARARTADYRSSLVLWRDTVTKAAENPRAHRELGRALMAAGRAREALGHFERAQALSPAETSARLDLAGALMTLGRVADAVPHYEAILREVPNHAAAQLELAAAFTVLGRKAEAEPRFQAARAGGISTAELHRRRGRALAERGDFAAAQAELEAALKEEPKLAETRVILGMVLSAMGHAAEGMRHFVAAVELNPADASAQAALGDALLENLRPAEALPHYAAALRLEPARAALLHASLGQALGRLGRVPEAIEHLEAALALNPENTEARANLELMRAAVRRHADKK